MRIMTKKNLEDAFAGESMACMKYTIYADKAERDGFPEVARLFRAIAYAERVHATNHFRALEGIKSTSDNLLAAKSGEDFEISEMYPAYDAVARLQGEKNAERSIYYALEAEKIHSQMYANAKSTVDAGRDLPTQSVYVCPVCGHTVIGLSIDECPICKLKKDKYVEF